MLYAPRGRPGRIFYATRMSRGVHIPRGIEPLVEERGSLESSHVPPLVIQLKSYVNVF